MPTIKPKCPHCSAITIVKSEEDLRPIGLQLIVYKLECGHSITEATVEVPVTNVNVIDESYNGYGGFRAFPYQIEGIEFIERSNFNALCADEMGLGKTPTGLLTYKRNKKNLTPTIVICKSSLHINWTREYCRWVLEIDPTDSEQVKSVNPFDLPFIHPSGEMGLPPGFNFYLVSMDMLAKKPVAESIKKMGVKLLIVDECHNFKDTSSKRTIALMEIAQTIPHKIMLSGTPLMNKTLEYFPILNIIKPHHFPTKKSFAGKFLDWDWQSKKWLGFTKYGKQQFFNLTKDYIIRRESKEVQKDLPEIFIQKHYAAEFDKSLAKQYNKLADELENAINDRRTRTANAVEILGIMSNMRHLTGLMKVTAILEHVREFLESTDEKITIGIHHVLVRNMLMAGLAEYNPIEISGADNGASKDIKLQEFKKPENRVLIANILAGGEGLNIQFCNNFVIAERQWNPAKEDQFVKRFHRHGQKLTVFGHFIIAADTIDDFFEQLLSFKKNVTTDSVDADFSSDRDFMVELARKVVSTRLRVVGM